MEVSEGSKDLGALRGLNGLDWWLKPYHLAGNLGAVEELVYLLCGVCLLCRILTRCSNLAAVNVNLEGERRGPYKPGSQGRCGPTAAAQPRGVRGPWELLNPCHECREPDTDEDLLFLFLFNFIPASDWCPDG